MIGLFFYKSNYAQTNEINDIKEFEEGIKDLSVILVWAKLIDNEGFEIAFWNNINGFVSNY